jgi:hypothetical protein
MLLTTLRVGMQSDSFEEISTRGFGVRPLGRVLADHQKSAEEGCHLCKIVVAGWSAQRAIHSQCPGASVYISVSSITDEQTGAALCEMTFFLLLAKQSQICLTLVLSPAEGSLVHNMHRIYVGGQAETEKDLIASTSTVQLIRRLSLRRPVI